MLEILHSLSQPTQRKMLSTPFLFSLVIAVTILFIFLWSWQTKKSNSFFIYPVLALVWVGLQYSLSSNNVYNSNLNALPPTIFLFGLFPITALTIFVFSLKGFRETVDSISLDSLILFNTIRIPVEIVLHQLYLDKQIPQLMTYEGLNFDIISGVFALILFALRRVGKADYSKALYLWLVVASGLLFNIVIRGILSVPTPFQKFGFEQPNIALIAEPYALLPTFIVPIVIFTHIVIFLKLRKVK